MNDTKKCTYVYTRVSKKIRTRVGGKPTKKRVPAHRCTVSKKYFIGRKPPILFGFSRPPCSAHLAAKTTRAQYCLCGEDTYFSKLDDREMYGQKNGKKEKYSVAFQHIFLLIHFFVKYLLRLVELGPTDLEHRNFPVHVPLINADTRKQRCDTS